MSNRDFWKNRIMTTWKTKSVIWLHGVRRTGKTTLCQSIKGALYLDCELPSVRRRLDDPEFFLKNLSAPILILDEIHRLENPSELLKIAADYFPTLKVLATGSSTLGATKKFRDSLTDRKRDIWLTPLLLKESSDLDQKNKKPLLPRRLLQGGLPPAFLSKDPPESFFLDWLDGYWAKDIEELFKIDKRQAFFKLLELLFLQSGGMFEPSSFTAACGISHPTVQSYLEIMEITHTMQRIQPFFKNPTREIISAPKVYGFDTGFLSFYRSWTSLTAENKGELWEHLVLNELNAGAPSLTIQYWRDKQKHEVDFIIQKRGQPPLAIECKWQLKEFDPANLKVFRKNYPTGENWVVAQDVEEITNLSIQGMKVTAVPLRKLGENLNQK